MIGGLILAGGRSSRFGREKAVAVLNGEPLIARVEKVLSCGTSVLAINARMGSAAAAYAAQMGIACLQDGDGDVAGPLAGVKAGLRWAGSQGLDWLATSPCDTPFLPADLVTRLHQGAGSFGAIATTRTGAHPLCAIWPTSALAIIETIADHPPMRAVLARIGAMEVMFGEPDAFANLNTPDDYAVALRRVA